MQTDLINYFDKLAPMDMPYIHTTEGKDDMPAHIKSALTNNQISLSIKDGKLLWEHGKAYTFLNIELIQIFEQ